MNMFTAPQHKLTRVYLQQSDSVTQHLNNHLSKWLNLWL